MQLFSLKSTAIFTLGLGFLLLAADAKAQDFYFGADQSYVNEMEDCGVVYYESNEEKDVYQIYKDYGNNLVRLRLWHTPKWYDNINSGKRYSDLNDVKKSIARAKEVGMDVLLDFHLSDNWADPSKQLVPEAWLSVVDDLPKLKDSLYNYIYNTLETLEQDGLTPEMVQIGNETNKGILLSPEDNQSWVLDWERNADLFNSGINAVRDFSEAAEKDVQIALHIAAPDNAGWLAEDFHENGVTDFDIIALSYYWAWHKPTSIEETGEIVEQLKETYGKEVLIVETGYIWTTSSNDQANNIISEVHPDYSPATPENQRDWLIALTSEMINRGAMGVCYWEPSWVSSDCSTQWGQGSHQEHATFFDFDNNLLIPGGIEWMSHDYGLASSIAEIPDEEVNIVYDGEQSLFEINLPDFDFDKKYDYQLIDSSGKILKVGVIKNEEGVIKFRGRNHQMVFLQIYVERRLLTSRKFVVSE